MSLTRKIKSLNVKRINSIRRKFLVISLAVLIVFILGGVGAFWLAMNQIIERETVDDARRTVSSERALFEMFIMSEITSVNQIAKSPIIIDYFSNPQNSELQKIAHKELEAYRQGLKSQFLFWVNTTDRRYYENNEFQFVVDPKYAGNQWYDYTLNSDKRYNLNVSFDEKMEMFKLYINARVVNNAGKAIGIVGTGIELSYFISMIFRDYDGRALLYFFDSNGKIVGAKDEEIVQSGQRISEQLEIGNTITRVARGILGNEIKYIDVMGKRAAIGKISDFGDLDWYITAVIYTNTEASDYRNLVLLLFIGMLIVLVSVFAVLNIFVRRLLKPLQEITNLLKGDPEKWSSSSITAKENDEIGFIASKINEFIKDNNTLTNKNNTLVNDLARDALTGIYNRHFFDENIDKIIKNISRGNGYLSLLFIDIDFFKKYNDFYGHVKGDECLRIVAKTIEKSLARQEDFVARYGGEEFIVVLPDTDENGAKIVALTIIENVRGQNIAHAKNTAASYVTISVGITTGKPKFSNVATDFTKRSDEALYKSKSTGRNKYTFEPFEE